MQTATIRPGEPSPRDFRLWLALALFFYLAICAVLYLKIVHLQHGRFGFSLDDPYIHLALAEQIAHGHYGINPGESASPSSSILWPFLLVPFARLASAPTIVLLLNLLAGLASCVVIARSVSLWPGFRRTPDEISRRALSVLGLIAIGNLIGLTFIGMEHTLQVFLAGGCAYGLIALLRGQRRIPAWCLVCAVLSPLVRYEGLALSLAMAIALWGLDQRRKAVLLMSASILPLLVFSLFLYHLGLPPLPSSVLVKGSLLGERHGAVYQLALQLVTNVYHAFTSLYNLPLTVLCLTLLALAWSEKDRVRRQVLFGGGIAAGLQVLIGRFNWFYRYEVYAFFFAGLLVLHVLHERPRMLLGWYGLGLLFCAGPYLTAIRQTPRSAQDIYLQQYQTHRFADSFYTGDGIAVNDLGLVSYHRRPGLQVLDLAGLGSTESARQVNKTSAWLEQITRRHHTGLVAIYSEWFAPAPPGWSLLGRLCLTQPPVFLPQACVTYFATPAAPPAIQSEFDAFARTLPPGIRVEHLTSPPPSR